MRDSGIERGRVVLGAGQSLVRGDFRALSGSGSGMATSNHQVHVNTLVDGHSNVRAQLSAAAAVNLLYRVRIVRVTRIQLLVYLTVLVVLSMAADAGAGEIVASIKAPKNEPFGDIVAITNVFANEGVEKVQLAVKDDEGISVRLSVSDDTPRKKVVALIEALNQAGVKTITIGRMKASKNVQSIDWKVFSAQRLRELRETRMPVLVYCRADWSVQSKMLDHTVFADNGVISAIRDGNFTAVQADHTKLSEETAQYLRRHGTKSVPTIVVYGADAQVEPIVLEGSISKEQLLKALKECRAIRQQ